MKGEGQTPPAVCPGFDIHYPCYLNPGFRPDMAKRLKDVKESYFDPYLKEDLGIVIDRSFRPATEILIDTLDEGFACALSISGVVVELLEAWYPDMLDLLSRAATHRNVELLAETYYHSVAGQFRDLGEFETEVLMHRDLMKDYFSAVPTTFAHTDYSITPSTAEVLSDNGIKAAIIEGDSGPALDSDPNHVYTYNGLPVIITHCNLADDIAVRFPWRDWDRWPLTADRYAEWISISPGECITLYLDYRVFGDTIGAETGILEFLHALPAALAAKGVESTHPSDAIARFPSHGDIGETAPPENQQRTILQQAALQALEEAGNLVADKKVWRRLLDTENLRRMAMRSTSCGKTSYPTSQQAAHDHFITFMRVLSDLEERSAPASRSPRAVLSLRCVSPEKAFHFSSHERPIGYAAHSLQEFVNILEFAPDDVVNYHLERGDFTRWIELVIGDTTLAKNISGITDRNELRSTIQKRIDSLWKRIR
ncbi:alpha-amylase [Methanoculleus sp.]|uniref:alpha-amylase n=1 Tax=Methanoculleus sp. TaxID=90427 RepID=UPI002610816D|nr:alpha-amylase [Methanoculleus sp.]MDI6866922.1 alpha-amylase [Methanoculleus sp.]